METAEVDAPEPPVPAEAEGIALETEETQQQMSETVEKAEESGQVEPESEDKGNMSLQDDATRDGLQEGAPQPSADVVQYNDNNETSVLSDVAPVHCIFHFLKVRLMRVSMANLL